MLPPIFSKETAGGNLFWCTAIIGSVMTTVAIFVPFNILWDMISLGVLLSFCITNSSLIAVRYAGPEGNKKLSILQVIFWIASSTGSFLLWKGYFEAYFDSSVDRATLSQANLIAAVSLVGGALLILLVIAVFFRTTEEAKADRGNIFNAPLCPFLPGIGTILNFLLMAQIDWINLGYLALFIAVGILTYLAYGVSHSMRAHEYDADEGIYKEPQRRKSSVFETGRGSHRSSIVLANTFSSIHGKSHNDDEIGQSELELVEKA